MSGKFDINEAYYQALHKMQMEEARSHKEDNEKAAPRDQLSDNGVARNRYRSSDWVDADIKRNRVSSKERAKVSSDMIHNNSSEMSDIEFNSNWKKSKDMRYEPAEYDLNKDSRDYKEKRRLAQMIKNGSGEDDRLNQLADKFDKDADDIVANRRNAKKEDYIRTNLKSTNGWNPQKLNISLNSARQTLQDLDTFTDAAENLTYADGLSDEFNEKLDEFIEEETWPEYDRIKAEVGRVEQDEINKSKGITTKGRKKKTEDIDEEDEDFNPMDETISLFSIAYKEIPDVGVEDWGKDDEMYFLLDTKKFLSDLEEYEVEIPKSYYDNASYDDWSNGVDDFLIDYCGIDYNSGKSDNTYNWSSRVTHDLEFTTYDDANGFYVKMSVHKEGDVRGNYTTEFLLRFDSEADLVDACLEAQADNKNTLELDGKHYTIEPDFWSERCNIWCEEDDDGWDDVYCENKEELRNIVNNSETNNY